MSFLKSLCVIFVLTCFNTKLIAKPVDLTLLGLDGKKYQLADYRGKWVIVNYWATWCPPCLAELPDLELYYNANKDIAVVLGINMEEIKPQKLLEFIDEQFLSFPIFTTNPAPRSPLGDIPGLPTTFIINPEGELIASETAQIDADILDQYIQKKIKQRENFKNKLKK